MEPIGVVVQGAAGRVGQEVVKALCRESGVQLVGAVELQITENYLTLPDGSGTVPFSDNLEDILTSCQPDVLVDFTVAPAVMPAVQTAAKQGVNLVIGTSGLTADELSEIDQLSITHKIGAVVAPNFALGAVLMIHMAKIAARYLDYAEIIELHHHQKVDAPSGTALSTAKAMAAARGKPFLQPSGDDEASASRGQKTEGVTIHSVRLPGLMAHQEILFGGLGQTLSLRHDMVSREGFIPGIMLAIREVVKCKGLVYGLESLLGL